MDITVGAVTPVGPLPRKAADPHGIAEATVLAGRPPRRERRGAPEGRVDQRRSGGPAQDPPGAKILVLMIVDGTAVPDDVLSGRYRVIVRFTRR